MRRKWLSVVLGCALVPLGYVIATPGSAGAATVTDHFLCQANAGSYGVQNADQDISFVTTGPASVLRGNNATFTVAVNPIVVPSSESGVTVNNIHNIFILLPDPANASFVSESLSPPGNGWTISHADFVVTLAYPGSAAGGSTLVPPTVTLAYNATGPALSTIDLRPGGNPPYNETPGGNPSFGLTANVNIVGDVPTTCVANGAPPPAIVSTLITGVDVTPPVITLTTPPDGAVYAQGSVVAASYSCNDGTFGSGVAYCTGPAANGAPIDTSTVGAHSFTVTSDDNNHTGPSSLTHNYSVISAPGISVVGSTVTEGPGAHVDFKVALSRPQAVAATVQYTTAPDTALATSDYTTTSGMLTFNPAGPYVQTVSVPVTNGAAYEPTESFDLVLSNATQAAITNVSTPGRIIDDDSPAARVIGGSVAKGPGASINFTIALAGHSFHPVVVNYATHDGTAFAPTDYTSTSGSVTFNPDDALTQTVNVPVQDSLLTVHDQSTFTFSATVAASGQTATGTGEILDPASLPRVNIGDVSVEEGAAGTAVSAKLVVNLSRPSSVPVVVRYKTVDGTAKSPGDYSGVSGSTPKTLIIEAGKVTKLISVAVKGDDNLEGDEQFGVVITSATNALLDDSTGTVTIRDDDPVTATTLSVGDVLLYQGVSGPVTTVNVPIRLSRQSAAPVVVSYTTQDGTATAPLAYGRVAKTVTIKANVTSVQVPIKVTTAAIAPGTVSFNLAILSASGAGVADSSGTVSIVANGSGAAVPGAPQSFAATTSGTALHDVDLAWTAPAGDGGRAITGYEYRVSILGGGFGPWISTGAGIDTGIIDSTCTLAACTYEVRAVNAIGAGPESSDATAAPLTDADAPALTL
ncbi:MAG TPA: Calx-beta domain-containing protein, partial [Acidimicrobiia bacterium]